MVPLLLWATLQFEPHLRRCYNMPDGNTMCTCASKLALYPPGESRDRTGNSKPDVTGIEHSAKDLYEEASKSQWEEASHQAATLANAVCGLENDIEGEQSNLSELDTRTARLMGDVPARDQASTMEEANEITRILYEPGTKLDPQVPLAIDMLDYAGRKLQIGLLRNDEALLRRTVKEMRHFWDEARPAVRATGERRVFMRFDVILRRLEHVKDLADYGPLVRVERDEAEKLESAFTNGAKELPSRAVR